MRGVTIPSYKCFTEGRELQDWALNTGGRGRMGWGKL